MSSIIVPAIQARMGTTSYYQAILRADELSSSVRAAMDFAEFESFMESERMQRAMNERRVEQEIVPYLCKSPDRFFGSIIVLAYETDLFEFTPWSSYQAGHLPAAMRDASNRAGVLEVSGGSLFALDGQHRLHALRTVVSGSDRTTHSKDLIEGPYRSQVADDEISVIFIPFEGTVKARRIFNKVNRYAKPTSHSTNILTSEDDGYAILTRCLVGVDDPDKFGGMDLRPIDLRRGKQHLVEFEKLNLATSSPMFTTLNTVYATVKTICNATDQPNLDERHNIVRPTDDILATAYDACATWWEALMTRFTPFKGLREFPRRIEGSRHMEEPFSLVFRPKGQEAFIAGLAAALRRSGQELENLIALANKIPLQLGSPLWIGVLAGSNGKMITKNLKLAEGLVTYALVGSTFSELERESLRTRFRDVKRDGGYQNVALPKPKG